MYLIEFTQGGDEICPLTGRLKVAQRLLDDPLIVAVSVVIQQF